jgi:hypothetical protein
LYGNPLIDMEPVTTFCILLYVSKLTRSLKTETFKRTLANQSWIVVPAYGALTCRDLYLQWELYLRHICAKVLKKQMEGWIGVGIDHLFSMQPVYMVLLCLLITALSVNI